MNKSVQNVDFYVEFEERYRGSRALIKLRQENYLPYINLLKRLFNSVHALDLGSGRGEWLELLGENGVIARGVDLSEEMLSLCQEKKFEVTKLDALTALKQCPSDSLQLVTGFHISEHLPFSVLVELVQEAQRVLSPGGVLILETPNSENIQVASSTFYLDPYHVKPIPSQLLSFLLTHCGFELTDVIRLNADINPQINSWITLNDVLKGVSRDYAAIGQKNFEGLSADCVIDTINNASGVSLDDLIERYDKQVRELNQGINDVMLITQHINARVRRLETPLRIVNSFFKKYKLIYKNIFK